MQAVLVPLGAAGPIGWAVIGTVVIGTGVYLIYKALSEPCASCVLTEERNCEEEWRWAKEKCAELISSPENNPGNRDFWRKWGNRGGTLMDCARGYVSEECGGNPLGS